ncbi:hypothetical protein IJT93_13020 [bacterium]|nr:hypothetical protein [bacterium]
MINGINANTNLPSPSQINPNHLASAHSGASAAETPSEQQTEDGFTRSSSDSSELQNLQTLRQYANSQHTDVPAAAPQSDGVNAAPAAAPESAPAAPAPPETAPAPSPAADVPQNGAPAPDSVPAGAPETVQAGVPLDLSAPNIVDVISSSAAELGAKAALGAIGGAAAYGAVSVFITASGVKELADGIKNHDRDSILGGTSNLTGGISSGLSTAAETVTALKGASAFSQVASVVAAPLGIASGALDIATGTQKTIGGIKDHDKNKIISGVLNVGFGTAMTASAVIGGLPALVAAGVLLAAKAGFSIYANHAAQRQQQNPAPEPNPAPASDSAPQPSALPAGSGAPQPSAQPADSGAPAPIADVQTGNEAPLTGQENTPPESPE